MRRLYRLVLYACPPAFRREHGREMEDVFVQCVEVERRRGGLAAVFAPWRGLADALRFAIRLRLERLQPTRGVKPPAVARARGSVMLGHDVLSALRLLRQQPAFSATVVATLALGIGAATAMVTLANAILVRPLPLPESDRLFLIQIQSAAAAAGETTPLSEADVVALRAQSRAFAAFAAFSINDRLNVTGDGSPEAAVGALVTPEFFDVTRIAPSLGRRFDRANQSPAVILSNDFWARRFHRDPAAVGRVLVINQRPMTIVGVMPAGFAFPRPVDLWYEWTIDPPARRAGFYLFGLGRLGHAVDAGRLQTDLDRVASGIKTQWGGPSEWRFAAESLKEQTVRAIRPSLLMLLVAVGCLLLVAIANAANLCLVRGIGRQREIAIRTALGGGRARVIRQLVIESLGLAVVAGACGLWLSSALIRLVRLTAGDAVPRLAEVRLGWDTIGLALGLSVVAGVLFGLLPSLLASRVDLAESLKQGGRTASVRHSRALPLAAAAQIALAFVLASSGALLLRSFEKLEAAPPGFQPDHLVTFSFSLSFDRYGDHDKRLRFFDRLLAGLRAMPGAADASLTLNLPPDRLEVSDTFTVEGRPARSDEPPAAFGIVADRAFATLGVPLLAGRDFGPQDSAASGPVVIVSDAIARRAFPRGDALGHRLRVGGPERPTSPWMTIVGIVGDVKYEGLASPASTAYYLPLSQSAWSGMHAVIRASGNPELLAASMRAVVRSVDPDLPVRDLETMDALMAGAAARPRFHTIVAVAIGVLGLVLAAFGIYSVVAYGGAQRRREFGVRLALGATRQHVWTLMIREGLGMAAVGTAVGLASALASTRWLSSLLYEVGPRDPVAFVALVAIFFLVTLVASLAPARRAMRVDPLIALRAE